MSEANSQPSDNQPKAPEEKTKPITDSFGTERDASSGEPVAPEAPKEEKSEDKPADVPASVAEQMTEMSEKLGGLEAELKSSQDLHKTKDDNIRAMAEKIKGLEGQIKNGAGGEEQEGEVPFKNIKRSKDLTDEEREEMTDTEIANLDAMADMQETINTMTRDAAKAKAEESDKGGEGDDDRNTQGVDVNKTVQEKAKELAGDDNDVANKIIEAFKGAQFNTADMSVEKIQESVELVAGTVTSAPKKKDSSPASPNGAPAGGGKQSDPHGVDSIVEQAAAEVSTDETYSL